MRGACAAILAAGIVAAAGAGAQQAPRDPAGPQAGFLILNQERLLTDSARGQALLAEEEAARERLRGEARAVESAFEAEERRLTEQRAPMAAADFRALADDFDARVVQARQDQDARASALALEFDQRRRAFYADVGPALVGVMESFGALAILDETSVLIADQALDITDQVIDEIDRADAPAPGPEAAPPAADAPPGPPAAGAPDPPGSE